MDAERARAPAPIMRSRSMGCHVPPSGALRAGRVVLCTGYTALHGVYCPAHCAYHVMLVPLLAGAVDGESYRHEDEGEAEAVKRV